MKRSIAIMQPYVFPYIGYFTLIESVDTFVFFNDVQYIKRGFINRNSILSQKKPLLFTIPVNKAPRTAKINEILIAPSFDTWKSKFYKNLQNSYSRAPFYERTLDLVSEVLDHKFVYIDELAMFSVKKICSYLNCKTDFLESSKLLYDKKGNGQGKIISISKLLEATTYVNAQNGTALYDPNTFAENKIDLKFNKPEISEYQQYGQDFVTHLSIIDQLMFLEKEDIQLNLKKYNLKEPDKNEIGTPIK